MRTVQIATLLFVLMPFAAAQPQKAGATEAPKGTSAVLEAKVKKAWEDYKNKDKTSFAAILADGFREVEDDGNGFRDAKAEVAEIDEFNIAAYTLKDFSVKPLGPDAALVNYVAEYSGSAGGEKVQEKDAYGEVWVKRGGDWKVLYVQSTKMK